MASIKWGGKSRRAWEKQAAKELRRAGRRLELRSFGLIPEHFSRIEGYRAALAVAVPLALAVFTNRAELGWSVFAAFWTCLCDAPGPHRLRRHLLAIFALCGAFIALAGSWFATFAPAAAEVVGPLLVFLAVLGTARVPYGGLLGTLLAVVAVVAVGFPQALDKALMQAAAFLAGAAWAYLLINGLWRIDPDLPLRSAIDAIVVRLLDMAESLVALGERPHRDEQWHSEHGEHRRAVRLAIERMRSLLDRYKGEAGQIIAIRKAADAAEAVFGALIALDQTYIDRLGLADERLAVAHVYRRVLRIWHIALRTGLPMAAQMTKMEVRVRHLVGRLTGEVHKGCALALEQVLNDLSQPAVATSAPTTSAGRTYDISRAVWQQALRQSAGLIAVYVVAALFRLGYPYWAAMAVIVVLQGGVRVTWARCFERILGSLLGGGMALLLLHYDHALWSLFGLSVGLAAVAIALRSVNYTIFVVFLTMLFVIVTEMLRPGAGIASARMVDNVIGSLTALLSVFMLWPDFGAPVKARIAEGIEANRLYYEAVESEKPIEDVEIARRNAGLASVEAELAFHDLGGFLHKGRDHQADFSALQDMRNLAGRAAIVRHRLLAQSEGL